MSIKSPLMFITIDEFKESNFFNNTLFDDVTTPDTDIWLAITQATSCVDYASGNNISTKWPEEPQTEFTDIVQTATAHQVRFILGKGVDYMRSQASIAQGGITYQQNNPNDPFYIVPEVYINLSKIKERLTFQGFPINVKPYRSNSFISGSNDNNPFESYLRITNLQSNDSRTKIIKTNPSGIVGTIVIIDTNNIKSIDNLTTEDLFQQYFSNDSLQLVDGKQGQKPKVISISDNIPNMLINELTYNNLNTKNKTISGAINEINAKSGGDSLWNDNGKNVDLQFAKDVNLQGYNLVKLGDPILEDDGVNLRTLNNSINELKNPWKEVGTISDNLTINYNFINNKKYKVTFNFNSINNQSNISLLRLEFLFNSNSNDITIHQQVIEDTETNLLLSLVINNTIIKILGNSPTSNYGIITKLEEYLY